MFSHSNNLLIAGGTLIDNHTSSHYHGTKATDILLANSAPGAFHDSGERFDPPRCHPGTRTHILKKIMDWVVGEVGWEGLIKWLYGSAGAGKSAITQTIAEMCYARHLLLASFFFSRTDPKRNNERCLIATIAYQIALNVPVMRGAIEADVDKDPAIFQRSIETQLKTLIVNPLTQLSKTGTFQSTPIPNLIIIDGLDECNDHRAQRHILHAISCAVQQSDVHLKFLICSRAEPQLTREFNSLTSKEMATCLALDDEYKRYDDIEQYLMDSFKEIATTHPLKAYIPSTWPTEDDLSTLDGPSFVNHRVNSFSQPQLSSMQPSRTASDRPFAELDALYMGILSFVKLEDVRATRRLLGVLILSYLFPKTPKEVGEFMFLDPGEVERLLLDLASVVECLDMDTEIQMLHASFPDFLLDRSRSGQYHIDASTMHKEIAQLGFSHLKEHESEGCATCLGGSRCTPLEHALFYITLHLSKAEPSSDLREALLSTCYITVLIQFASPYLIFDLLTEFLFFLRHSKFIDAYLHHCNIYDRIMCKRIADLPVDLGSIVGLVLAGLHLNIAAASKMDEYFADYFPAVEGGLWRIYQTLYSESRPFYGGSDYKMLLTEFLTNPGRAGVHALDGPKFALAAKFLSDCFITPYSECNSPRVFEFDTCSNILSETGILLSKASRSDQLVTRINHAHINCQFLTSQNIFHERREVTELEASLRTFIKEIGDYLKRVVGLVPINLRITLRVYDETTSAYGGPTTLGPLYYKDISRRRSAVGRALPA